MVTQRIKEYKTRRLKDKYARIGDSRTAFNEVYASNFWGEGVQSRSGVGSVGPWLESSIQYVRDSGVLAGRDVVEIGCGDFNFGRRICSDARSYTGVDVASIIVENNQRQFAGLPNVRFLCADAASEDVPAAETYIVRQVLQHLPNAHVKKIVERLLSKRPRDIVVFEHVQAGDYVPNVDLEFPGPFTRSIHQSGLDLRRPPFEFPFVLTAEFPHEDYPSEQSMLACYHYKE
jgi:SAM-dependent methyltransferase